MMMPTLLTKQSSFDPSATESVITSPSRGFYLFFIRRTRIVAVVLLLLAGSHLVVETQQSTSWVDPLNLFFKGWSTRNLDDQSDQTDVVNTNVIAIVHGQNNVNNSTTDIHRIPRLAVSQRLARINDSVIATPNGDKDVANFSTDENLNVPHLKKATSDTMGRETQPMHPRGPIVPAINNVSTSFSRRHDTFLLKNQTPQIGKPLTHGVLDLVEWELQSVLEYENVTDPEGEGPRLYGVCRNPEGISNTCCLGSFSGGGSVTRDWAHHCFKGEDVYNRLAETVLRELERTNALVDDDDACDVCRVVDIINRYDLKFAFSGDSVMSQNVDGFFCELQRRGYNVTMVNDLPVDPDTTEGIKNIFTHEISGPQHWQKPTTVKFIFQYKLLPDNNVSQIETMAVSHDVLVMNFGVHYPDKDFYQDTMSKLLNVTSRGNITLLAHRETSAQHFNSSGGEWIDEMTACVPHKDTDSAILGWRDRVVTSTAKEFGYKVVVADETIASVGKPNRGERELVIIPFFNITSASHYLHPDECTHFCSTPYLWMPVWRGLRLAMDRQWADVKK